MCGATDGLTCFVSEPCRYATADGERVLYEDCNCDRHPAAARRLAVAAFWAR